MANVKISQLPAAGPLATTDALPLVQGTATAKATVANLDSRYFRKGQEEAPGTELQYLKINSLVTVTATTLATAQTVIPGTSRTYDGTLILITFFSGGVQVTPSGQLILTLWDGASNIGWLGQTIGSTIQTPVHCCRRINSSGAHSYSVKAHIISATTGYVQAGNGTNDEHSPAFLRITKV